MRRRETLLGGLLGTVIFLTSCAERDTIPEEKEPALHRANQALQKAEEALKAANVDISFDDIAHLDDLRQFLPSPDEIASVESQENLETAIASFYDVFDTLNVSLDPIELVPLEAPSAEMLEITLSESDLALIHLYLGYAYTLEAIARVQAVGGDLYTIEYTPDAPGGQIYKFRLLRDVRGLTPSQVLALFNEAQRRAALDIVALLTGGKIRAGDLRPSLNPEIYRRSALYHFAKAADLAVDISPQLKRAMEDLMNTIETRFTAELLAEIEDWGFTLEALPSNLKELVR